MPISGYDKPLLKVAHTTTEDYRTDWVALILSVALSIKWSIARKTMYWWHTSIFSIIYIKQRSTAFGGSKVHRCALNLNLREFDMHLKTSWRRQPIDIYSATQSIQFATHRSQSLFLVILLMQWCLTALLWWKDFLIQKWVNFGIIVTAFWKF